MDSCGEEEFEEALRAYASQGQSKFSLRDIANDVREYDATNGTELYDWLSFVESGSIAKNKTQFHIANTGEILNEYGIKGKINVTRKAINVKRHTDNGDHKLGVSGWAFLVATINNPLVITRYNNKPNSHRIYTIAEINGKNICAGVDVNATKGVEITKITTAFGRDITKIKVSSKEKEIYRNENAAEQISGSDNWHLYARLLSTTKVIQNFENPKIEPKSSLRALDAPYLEAVERGDMETAQRMVLETTDSPNARFSLRTMREGVDFLKGISNKYNIGVPMILVENASEYVAMMREWGIKNAETKARAFATYLADEMLICFNGTHFLDADAEFIEDAALHEYAHHATAQAWEEVITLVATMNRDDILWVRDNMLTEYYNDISAENTINEIISTFVETMDAKVRTAAFNGEIDISKIVESVHEEIINDTEIDDKGKRVLTATLPLVAKALEFIKEKYNGERETTIVLRRDAGGSGKLDEESETQAQETTMAMRNGDWRDRGYSQPYRVAGEGSGVTHYSLPSGKGVDLDIPFIDEMGNVVETTPVRSARTAYAMMEERIEIFFNPHRNLRLSPNKPFFRLSHSNV